MKGIVVYRIELERVATDTCTDLLGTFTVGSGELVNCQIKFIFAATEANLFIYQLVLESRTKGLCLVSGCALFGH